ncbi:YceI family protein [Sphingobacterium alkalisoli]|uniref:YceI family protein n=1 Tax=Sphingobacterium alkalisoli TaxID=1874115 RepID=A0A4U0H459_9SPHI|nr:YceI family protein [Sphingobacterium alkalisoli]TJY65964.1 YceI family protein [Sphingobacterium alkalisoli]GGH17158.1 polyisoprenoid-binding protein [Sphingobacterium alkalisoli]
MKTTKLLSLGVLFLVLSTSAMYALIDWKIMDNDYVIKFETKKASGTISGLKGVLHFDPDNLAGANMDVTVDVNTLDLGNGLKTKHAKADDFFDVEQYPTIHFKSTGFKKVSSGYQVDGNLTLKSTTKPISILFTFESKASVPTFLGAFELNRTDYGLTGKGSVGEILKLNIKVPVSK